MLELNKVYEPSDFEQGLYDEWETRGYFRPSNDVSAEPFSIILPPPNVTGVLHMGHALTITIQDIVVRHKRMQGFNTVWVPGTDHAGIATQMVVERQIAKEGLNRHALGRENFIKKVWEVKNKHHDIMINQMKTLGGSLDWERERFSLDEGFSRAVNKILVHFWEKGTLYQGERLISWCHRCGTALSDLEVEVKEEKGHLYYIKYAVEGEDGFVTIATTRPETLLGDTAVAVNPNDDRFKFLHNKKLIVPIVNRAVPVILDEHVEIDFGTACLKITPAHDFNDYEIGQKHKLDGITVIGFDGKMNKNAGKYEGLTVQEAREQILKDLEQLGQLEKIEDYNITMSRCSRCNTVIEPLLSKQWFLKMEDMAKRAIDVVKTGKIEFYPKGWWEQTYYNWLENIRDWCISRQLWWGHQLPIWYCNKCGKAHVLELEPDENFTCECGSNEFTRETDVLDTWFSAALWPFVGFGWPEDTLDLKTFYPNALMETGFDILFFWVARMIMFGLEFMNDVPFKHVLFHAMIRDEKGQKMSKTKGNVIDPLDITSQYGVDALRFTLASMAGRARDIKLSEKQIEVSKHFMNKIWQASRFVFSKADGLKSEYDLNTIRYDLNKWILSKFYNTVGKVNEYLKTYEIDHATEEMYKFFWGTYCDWFLEFSKSILDDKNNEYADETRFVLFYVHKEVLKLMHIIVPFITEKIYLEHPLKDSESIMLSKYPSKNSSLIDKGIENKFQAVIDAISAVRNIKATYNITSKVSVIFYTEQYSEVLYNYENSIKRLAGIENFTVSNNKSFDKSNYVLNVFPNLEVYLLAEGVIDINKETSRLEKKLSKVLIDIKKSEARLHNERFMRNAQQSVIDKEKRNYEDLNKLREELVSALDTLKSLGGNFEGIYTK